MAQVDRSTLEARIDNWQIAVDNVIVAPNIRAVDHNALLDEARAILTDVKDSTNFLSEQQTFIASNTGAQEDTDSGLYTVNGDDIFLGLELTVLGYQNGDVVSFTLELPSIQGSAGNTEVRLEMVFDKGGPNEIVIAEQTERIGNDNINLNTNIRGIVSDLPEDLPAGTIGVYGTAVRGTTTVDNGVDPNGYLLATRTRNFSFKGFPA